MAKPVDQMTGPEFLRDVAVWFSQGGDVYSQQAHARLIGMAQELERLGQLVAVVDHRREVCRCGHINDAHDEESECTSPGCGCGLFVLPMGST
jgi:hypothetical protein